MKKTVLLVATLFITGLATQAQIDLKKVGGKALDKAKDAKDNKATETKTTETKSTTTISSSDTGPDLFAKGEKAFEEEKWKEALEYYEAAEGKGYMDGMMKVKMNQCRDNMASNPEEDEKNNNFLNETMGKLDAMKYKKDPVVDNGLTNDFHKANVGKIVFSKQEIVKATSSDAQLGKSFAATDDIYGRVYLSQSLTNEAYSIGVYPTNNFRYRITVGNTVFAEWAKGDMLVGGDQDLYNKWTTFQLALTPNASNISEYPDVEYQNFFKKMYNLPIGTHQVKVEIVFDIPDDDIRGDGNDYLYTTKFGAEKIVASGEFTFNLTQAGKEAMARKLCPKFDWLGFHTNLVPDAFAMVDKSKRSGEKVLKVVVYDNDWTYVKNGYGIITSRKIGGRAIIQDVNTKLCYEVGLTFYQENISSGGDKYGSTTFDRSLNAGINQTGITTPLFLEGCIK